MAPLPGWVIGTMAAVLASPALLFSYLIRGKVNIGCTQTWWFFIFIITVFLACIVLFGTFNYGGLKWLFYILGLFDVVSGLVLLWFILGREKKEQESGERDDLKV